VKIALSAGETGLPRSANPAELLETFLAGLPVRGPDARELSAPENTAAPLARGGHDVPHVVLAAQALMAADPTGTMTIDRAVRQITGQITGGTR